jgi:acyl-coenzyme A thioesterase PaaI-like protein
LASNGLQPNSRNCFVCGIQNPYGLRLKFYQSGPGEVAAETSLPPHFQGFPGIVHGGIVTALLDEALGRAHMGVDPGETRFVYTARIEVRFRRTVPIGEPIHLHGRVEKERSSSILATASITNTSGEILAEAEGLLVDVPAEMLSGFDLQQAGWKVYGGGGGAAGG